jgi:hypothetical protein
VALTPAQQAAGDVADNAQKMLLLLTADWLNNDRTHAAEIMALLAVIIAASGPPTNIDVPYASQDDATTLSCTLGNWDGQPTGYTFAWHTDGVANGATGETYAVQPGDVDHGLACVVTATNALGSTAAPMSNTVVVADV